MASNPVDQSKFRDLKITFLGLHSKKHPRAHPISYDVIWDQSGKAIASGVAHFQKTGKLEAFEDRLVDEVGGY